MCLEPFFHLIIPKKTACCGHPPGGGQKARGYSTSFPLWDSYVAGPSFNAEAVLGHCHVCRCDNFVVNQGKLVTTRQADLWKTSNGWECFEILLYFVYFIQVWSFFLCSCFFCFILYWIRQHFAKQSWQGTLTVFLLLLRLKCDCLHFISVWHQYT